jgi:hypothetical protein
LPHQPIFYPVLEKSYAIAIAQDWNTGDEASGYVGFVTEFDVEDAFAARYAIQIVGGREHRELWVPAEDLASFNEHLLGTIKVVGSFVGANAGTVIDSRTHLPRDISDAAV